MGVEELVRPGATCPPQPRPTTATTCPCPARARARACCRASNSGCRPTKRVRPRAAAACKRRRRALAPPSSKTSTGSAKPLMGTGPSGVTWTALREAQDGRREQNRARDGQLLHAGGQMGRLAHRGVIHVQIIANGAHHDFPELSPTRICRSRPRVRRTSWAYGVIAACMARAA